MEGPSSRALYCPPDASRDGSSIIALFIDPFRSQPDHLKLWSLNPFSCTTEISRPCSNDDYVTSLCLFMDLKALLGTRKGHLEVWDLSQGPAAASPLTALADAHGDQIWSIKSASLAPSIVLTGSQDTSLKLWDLRTNACVRIMETGVSYADIDANAKVAVSTDTESDCVRVWDLGSGLCISSVDLQDPGAEGTPSVFLHESGEAMIACNERTFSAWRTSDLTQPLAKATLPGMENVMLFGCSATADLTSFAIGRTCASSHVEYVNDIIAWN